MLAGVFSYQSVIFAGSPPDVVCDWLPGCSSGGAWQAGGAFFSFLWELISQTIQYVAVVAVIALMISGIMYLISGWEEEKVAKAKKMILWSLVWVLLSTSAWAIINLLNSFSIN